MTINENVGSTLLDDLENPAKMLKELIQEVVEKGLDFPQYDQESEALILQCINNIDQDLDRFAKGINIMKMVPKNPELILENEN